MDAANRNVSVKLIRESSPCQIGIDGQAVLPLIFFFNTDVQNNKYLAPQVKLAAGAGVHMYSFPLRLSMRPGTSEPDFEHGERLLRLFTDVDPEAKFLVRLVIGPHAGWKEFQPWGEAGLADRTRYADGTLGDVSFASDHFGRPTDEQLRKIVAHYEASAFGERMIAYHCGGDHSEMFERSYRWKGPDYSPANTVRFRTWLRGEYASDAELQQAWHSPAASLAAAAIPRPDADRFPMRQTTDRRVPVFYDPQQQRDWIDYSLYYNELMSDYVIRWARIVKEVTSGKKLTIAFYGYLFTLPGSISGHLGLHKVLHCDALDILSSPYDYYDRAPGGTANFVTPVDSIELHGKLWINEDDARTHLMDPEVVNQSKASLLKVNLPNNMAQTLGVLDRNIAAVHAHGCGIWWMDLIAAGSFNSPEIWEMIQRRMPLLAPDPDGGSITPEVAVVVDEASKMYLRADLEFNERNLYQVRDGALKTGATIGYYLLEDYLEGATPNARMVIFANTYRLSDAQIDTITDRLAEDHSSVIWVFMPGYLDENGTRDVERVRRLSGFAVRNVPGKIQTVGQAELAGCVWNDGKLDLDLTHRPVLETGDWHIIGSYADDGRPAAAVRRQGEALQFFLGSPGPGADATVLRQLFRMAGVHLWAPHQEAIVQSNGKNLAVYTGKAGRIVVRLPAGVTATAMEADIVEIRKGELTLKLDEKGIAWLRLGSNSA